jgi:hypothetical protein
MAQLQAARMFVFSIHLPSNPIIPDPFLLPPVCCRQTNQGEAVSNAQEVINKNINIAK